MDGDRKVNNTDTHAIFTEKLGRSFDGIPAVSDLNLSVSKGEMFGLVGPDGAGKSTTIRLLCGLLKPSTGHGTVLGFDLADEPEKIKARIGYLSQDFTLYGDLTIDENIEFFAGIHDVTVFKNRRDELLTFTGLTPFRNRLAGNLSGGMKKKLALACTLIHQPDIIFLDEPSTGVDPVSRGEFWNILSAMTNGGMTVVLTTPYLDEAERFDRIALMHHGKIITTASPASIKGMLPGKIFNISCRNPESAYRILRSRWQSEQLMLFASKLRFWTTRGNEETQQALTMLETQGFGPVTISETDVSMEDAFIGLIAFDQKKGDKR
jgi:ABC-2 type transport system ATP-binding protein